jgi:alpha-D-ribose 1-methylphosphonate 5-triphosphate synthase subunit PhnI
VISRTLAFDFFLKFDVVVSQMINKAIGGDAQAQKVLRDWYRVFAYSEDKAEALTVIISAEDAKL